MSRLDAPVTGVVLLARTSKAAAAAHRTVPRAHGARRSIGRWSKARLSPPSGDYVDWLVHDERHRRDARRRPAAAARGQGGPARLPPAVGRRADVSLVEVELETGRKAPDPRADWPITAIRSWATASTAAGGRFRRASPCTPGGWSIAIRCGASRCVSRPRCRRVGRIPACHRRLPAGPRRARPVSLKEGARPIFRNRCALRLAAAIRQRSSFEKCALASGLLTRRAARRGPGRACAATADSPPVRHQPPTDQQLADRLVEMGLLNAWQAKQLLDGRTKFTLGPYRIVDSHRPGRHGPGLQGRSTRCWAARWPSRSCPATSPRPRPSPISPAKSRPWPSSNHPQAGPRPGRRPRRQRLLPGDRVRARHRPAQAGPPQRAA